MNHLKTGKKSHRGNWSTASADLSSCGKFRYGLKRWWGEGSEMLFIMLNPSTADSTKDDPTIRRCISFAMREGCGSLKVENLFAYRSKSPDVMFASGEYRTLVGDESRLLSSLVSARSLVVAAWGSDKRARLRSQEVTEYASLLGVQFMCLGKTANGSPRHPLYVRSNQPMIHFP